MKNRQGDLGNIQFQLTSANNVAEKEPSPQKVLLRVHGAREGRGISHVYVTQVPINNNIYSIKRKYLATLYRETWINFAQERATQDARRKKLPQ